MTTPDNTSKAMLWTGRVLSALVVLFFLMDVTIKALNVPQVAETSAQLGWQLAPVRAVAILLFAGTVLYVYPRTAILGAIILTGYLGGAVATHVRVDSPLFSHILFGVYLGVMVWGGLWFRDARLRALIPLSR